MKIGKRLIASALGIIMASQVQAAEVVNKDEAVAMVKKAVAFIKANGVEKGYAEINNKQGQFVDRDLYVVVYDLNAKCIAHGANPKLIGKDMSEVQDVDGVYYAKERANHAKTKKEFWHDYKFSNPVSKKIEPKTMYCEVLDNTTVCGGIYKK